MHITLLAYGTRGDTQPFLALAIALKKAGHTVRLAGPERFSDLAARHGVPFTPLVGNPADISLSMSDAGVNVYRMVKTVKDHIFTIASQVVQQARTAVKGADLLVHSFLFTTGAHSFACEMDIPDISVQTFPMFATTRAFPSPAFANIPPGTLSSLSHWMAKEIFWHGGNFGFEKLRKDSPEDFPQKLYWPFRLTGSRLPTPLIFAYSPAVLPKPVDWTASHIFVPGYFFLDEPGYNPPPELTEFLERGEPPICFSFGSTVHRESERIGKVVLEALKEIRGRGVILTGWGGWKPTSMPKDVCYLEEAPHDWLFPRCTAIIHHGGAGTTGIGLRTGVPNIIIPHGADQPFWGKRVADIGAGPIPIPVKRLDVDALSTALHQALHNTAMRQAAEEIGKQIREEDGVKAAVQLIEAWASAFSSR
jgi:sterol 3beta-glucosyltransferase